MADDWLWMTAADLGRGIEAGRIEPRELAAAYLEAIEAHPEADAIYVRTTRERAEAEAAAAAERARRGLRRGPLDGVPVAWKDLFDTAGVATEAGSALLRGRVPEQDAAVLRAATRAGLVCLGKTHMTELAFSGLGVNPMTATPPNINDPELAPGGSSSGSAAAVAFGLAAAGIGSDTGGSVRVPAAWNDLVGLKTTHGLLPLGGVVPLCPSFDTVGPLCRSVEDAAALLAVLSGGPPADLAGGGLDGRALLVCDTSGFGPTRPGPETAFEAAVDRLARAGARIERRRIEAAEAALPLAACVFTVDAYAEWSETIEANPSAMYPPVLQRFRAGAGFSGTEYVNAWRRLERLRAAYLAETEAFDAVLLPTTANAPPVTAELIADADHFTAENLLTLRNTRVANLLGLAALTLPTGEPSLGVTAMGRPLGEAALLRLGAAMERALG
jgi:aspartyl-tRNA(Asn)/glutamyl-tRNA(Gln) amidotransferase subunit A